MVKIFAFLFCLSSFCFGETLVVNRLLLKINDSAYTQRELEIFLLIKAIQKRDKTLLASEQNWKLALKNFKNDMLLYEESRKLRYSIESSKDLSTEVQQIKDAMEADAEFKAYAGRLGIHTKDIEQKLRISLRIEKYKIDQRDSAFENPNAMSARFSLLEKRNYVRYYNDADVYVYIQPNAFVTRP